MRREHGELRHLATRELERGRGELARVARQVTTACLELYTNMQYVTDSQGDKVGLLPILLLLLLLLLFLLLLLLFLLLLLLVIFMHLR